MWHNSLQYAEASAEGECTSPLGRDGVPAPTTPSLFSCLKRVETGVTPKQSLWKSKTALQ